MPPTWVTDNGPAALSATDTPLPATMPGEAADNTAGAHDTPANGDNSRPPADSSGAPAPEAVPTTAPTTPGRPATANVSPRSLATATRLLSEALEGYTSPAHRGPAAPSTDAGTAVNQTAGQTVNTAAAPATTTITGSANANGQTAPVPATTSTSNVPAVRRQTSPPIDAETPPPAYSLVAARPRDVQHSFGSHIAGNVNPQRQAIGAAQRQQFTARAAVQAALPFVGQIARQNAVGFDTIPRQAPRPLSAPRKPASPMETPDGLVAFVRLLPALDSSLIADTDRPQWLEFLFANVEAQDKHILRAHPQKAQELASKYAPRIPVLLQAFVANGRRLAVSNQPGVPGQQRPPPQNRSANNLNASNVQPHHAMRPPPVTSHPQPLQPVQQNFVAPSSVTPTVPMRPVLHQQQPPVRPMQQQPASPQVPTVTADDPIAIRCALAQQQAASHFQQGWDRITVLTDANNELLRARSDLNAQILELQQQIAHRDSMIQTERQRATDTQKAAELHAARQGEVARNSLHVQREADLKKIQALEHRIRQLTQTSAEEVRKFKGEMDVKQEALARDAQEKRQGLESQIESLKSQLQNGHSAEVADLKEKLQKRTAMMTKLQEEKEQEIAALHDGYRTDMNKSTKKIEDLQASNAKLEAWKESLSSQQRKLKKELDGKSEELRLSSEKVTKLESEVEDITRSMDSLEKAEKRASAEQRAAVEEFAEAMKAMEAHHKAQYDEISAQLAATTQSKAQEVADLSSKLKEAQASLDKVREDYASLAKEKVVLEQSLDSAKQELATKNAAKVPAAASLPSTSQAEQPRSQPAQGAARPSWATSSAPAATSQPIDVDRTSRPGKRRAESPLFLSGDQPDDGSDEEDVSPANPANPAKRQKRIARSSAVASATSTPTHPSRVNDGPAGTPLPAKQTLTQTATTVKIEPTSTPSRVTDSSRKPMDVVNTNLNVNAVTVDEAWMKSRRHKFITRHDDGRVSCALCSIGKKDGGGGQTPGKDSSFLPGKPSDEKIDKHIMTEHHRLLLRHRIRRLQQGREPCPPGWLKEA